MKGLDNEDPEKDVYHTSYGLEGGAQIAEVLREKGYDGVVFGEDLTAVGALNQWKKDGVKIPEEISLIGCNNSEYSYVCSPALTTVNNKGEVLSELTVRMLLDVLEKKERTCFFDRSSGTGSEGNDIIQPERKLCQKLYYLESQWQCS